MKKVIGIDFGTHNSLAVFSDGNEIRFIKHAPGNSFDADSHEGKKEMPSFVFVNNEGSVEFVGSAAKQLLATHSQNVAWGLKRIIGMTYNSLGQFLERFGFAVFPDTENGKVLLTFNEGRHEFTPNQLIAEIFRQLKYDIEQNGIGDEDYDEVIFSVPAYYTPVIVSEIIDAAIMAGFKKDKIKTISEPVAAALAYGANIGEAKITTMLFDMGCGTTDISVGSIEMKKDEDECVYEARRNIGARIGGMEITECLTQLICQRAGVNMTGLPLQVLSTIRQRAEQAKIELSFSERVNVLLGDIVDSKNDILVITGNDLKTALKTITDECYDLMKYTIEGAGLKISDIDRLLIVGGPMISPVFSKMFLEFFGSNPKIVRQIKAFYMQNNKHDSQINRMTAIGIGAALSGFNRTSDRQEFGFGIEGINFINENTVERFAKVLIPEHSVYPYTSEVYSIPWSCIGSGYNFKILQVSTDSQNIKSFHFMGVFKFRSQFPFSEICLTMEINANKELITRIWDAYDSSEVFQFEGFKNDSANDIVVTYPVINKYPEFLNDHVTVAVPPSANDINEFISKIDEIMDVIERNIGNSRAPEVLVKYLQKLRKQINDDETDPTLIFNLFCCLLHNASYHGFLSLEEQRYAELLVNEFEQRIFKYKTIKNK